MTLLNILMLTKTSFGILQDDSPLYRPFYDTLPYKVCYIPGVAEAVFLVLCIAEGALAAYSMGPWQRDVLLQ